MKTRQRYQDIRARFDTNCAQCKERIIRGTWAVWDSKAHKLYCAAPCGKHLPVQSGLFLPQEQQT